MVWILGVGKRVGEGEGAERAVKMEREHGGEPDQQSEWGGLCSAYMPAFISVFSVPPPPGLRKVCGHQCCGGNLMGPGLEL